MEAGADRELILKTIERCLVTAKSPPRSLSYFDGAVRDMLKANITQDSDAHRMMDRILATQKAKAA